MNSFAVSAPSGQRDLGLSGVKGDGFDCQLGHEFLNRAQSVRQCLHDTAAMREKCARLAVRTSAS